MEEIAPHELAEPWDNPGLQLGVPDQEIKVIYFALDPVLNSIKKAIKYGANLLVTHHPLLFKPVSSLNTDTYPGNVIEKAMKHNISIISAHTNLDAAPGGLNDILAEMLDLKEVEVLKENQKMENAGLGRVGNLRNPILLKDFLEEVKKVFKIQKIRVVGALNKNITRVAVVGGSGGGFIPFAIQKEADVLITGDIGYHDALNALSYGLTVINVGHFSAENSAYMIFSKRFGAMLKEKGFEVKIILDNDESDPFCLI